MGSPQIFNLWGERRHKSPNVASNIYCDLVAEREGQGVNKENPLTRVYAKRAANQFSGSLRVCSLSHGNKYSPPCPWIASYRGASLSNGEEPYRAIISASLRQCPLVPRVGGG